VAEHERWDVVRDNIASCAAIKAVIGHSKRLREVQYCGPADTLFVNDTTRFHIISPQKNALVGSHLFYAQAQGRVIRSGKAVVTRTLALASKRTKRDP